MSLAFLMGIVPGSFDDDTRKSIRGEWTSEKVYFVRHQELDMKSHPPRHTEAGLARIKKIILPADLELVLCGTGAPFVEILNVLRRKLPESTSIGFSPFCGEHNYDQGKYRLADGTLVDPGDYVGIKIPYLFNPWRMIASVPKPLLIIGGGELFNALGLEESCGKPKNILYELFVDDRRGKVLQ